MSVICYGPHELANVCAACSAKTGLPVQSFFKAAIRYSQDNVACYLYNYREEEDADPVTSEDLQAYLPSQVDFDRAALTAGLLRYNLVSNDGRDFGDVESLEACAVLCEAITRRKTG